MGPRANDIASKGLGGSSYIQHTYPGPNNVLGSRHRDTQHSSQCGRWAASKQPLSQLDYVESKMWLWAGKQLMAAPLNSVAGEDLFEKVTFELTLNDQEELAWEDRRKGCYLPSGTASAGALRQEQT